LPTGVRVQKYKNLAKSKLIKTTVTLQQHVLLLTLQV